ncbi:MAG: ftsK 2, partial [Phycisphaerales bacterium]|nr:ftsK 2 [Phycisphaerales bacterium]
MTRSNLPKTVAFFLAAGLWAFLLLSFWSFSPTDWPSHAVDPYPPTANWCGAAGAVVAYGAYLAVGQGVFPVLAFAGVLLGGFLARARVGDVWMRAVGLTLVAVAFAAGVNHFWPGSPAGLPEGRGGVLGIGAAGFLHKYFSTAGTLLLLGLALLIGLLLAADDLLLAAPRALGLLATRVKEQVPQVRFHFDALPRLPALPGFVTRDAVFGRPAGYDGEDEQDDGRPQRVVARKALAGKLTPAAALAARAASIPPARGGQVFRPDPSAVAAAEQSNWMQRIGNWAGFRSRAADDAVIATLNNDDPTEGGARGAGRGGAADEDIELSYRDDDATVYTAGGGGDGAAHEAAWADDPDDFGPSEPAVIPPPDQQKPVRAAPVIRLPGQPPMQVPRANAAPVAAVAAAAPAVVFRPAAMPARPAVAAPVSPAVVRPVAQPVPAAVTRQDPDDLDSDVEMSAQARAVDAGPGHGVDDEDDDDVVGAFTAGAIPIGADEDDAAIDAGHGLVPEAPVVRKDIVVKLPSMVKPRQSAPSPPPPQDLGEYQLPDWSCLDEAEGGYAESQEAFVRDQAALLEQALREFNIDAHVTEIDTGPVITMYELALAPGIKVSAISGLSNDIQRSLRAETIRIVAPIPGKNTVGIEVPNEQKEKVRFKDLMQIAPPEQLAKMDIPLFLGKDASGEALITDLAKMPHALIAGTTGSGKSVCINTIIMSILYKQRPDAVKLVLFDPKVVEMAMYKDIPHLMCPVINDASKATSVLEWACEKMDERYEFLAEAGVRNIKGYNSLTQEELIERFQPGTPEEEAKIPKKMPYIVIIIDELADLMMTSGKEVEASIVRIAQKARAVGIHLILATQRPSANVVTGLI